ncbi:hypothetical protein PGN61_22830 [Klebsiella aerogenes]
MLVIGMFFISMQAKAIPLQENNGVVEVVTAKLKTGVTPLSFSIIDKKVGRDFVSKQPGFISRETGFNDDGEWLVIVHWKTINDADNSMRKFKSVPEAQTWMDSINVNSMNMSRYEITVK